MNLNITIGQYYPTESIIHSLDPRIKLLGTLAFIVTMFIINNVFGYAVAFLFLAVLIKISNVPVKLLLRGLRGILFIVLFTFILNIFITPGKTILFQYGIIKITSEGLLLAVKMTVRLTFLVVASSLLTLTTSPIKLTDAIEYLLKPFKKIGVNSHEIAMMMTIALRFIPTILEEMDKIMKAQKARGADFESGGIIKRAKSLVPILVPLFLSSFRRADELAIAMEARCYRGDINRTRMKEMKFVKTDYIASIILIIFVAVIVATRFIVFY